MTEILKLINFIDEVRNKYNYNIGISLEFEDNIFYTILSITQDNLVKKCYKMRLLLYINSTSNLHF